jgi:hypothetical protein
VLVDEVGELVVAVAVVPALADLFSALASFVSTFVAFGALVFEALVTFAVVVVFGAFACVTLGAFGAVVVFVTFGAFVEEAFAGDCPCAPFGAAWSGTITRVRTIAVPAAIFTKCMRITSRAGVAMWVPIRPRQVDCRKFYRINVLRDDRTGIRDLFTEGEHEKRRPGAGMPNDEIVALGGRKSVDAATPIPRRVNRQKRPTL